MANSTADMMPGGLESDEESSPFETSIIIPNSVLNALLIPICIAGNVLVLVAVWRNPSLRTPSTILLCSLAVSDLFVGFLHLPVNIAIALIPLSRDDSLSRLPQARIFLNIQLCCVSLACVAWRFWLGELSNKGGRGQRNREEIGAGATFSRGFAREFFVATPLLRPARQNRHATQAISDLERIPVDSLG